MKKHPKLDTFILALTLFATSGAILAYNLHTVGGGELAVSLYDLIEDTSAQGSAVSTYSEANILSKESIFTSGSPSAAPADTLGTSELLPPIVTPPIR